MAPVMKGIDYHESRTSCLTPGPPGATGLPNGLGAAYPAFVSGEVELAPDRNAAVATCHNPNAFSTLRLGVRMGALSRPFWVI